MRAHALSRPDSCAGGSASARRPKLSTSVICSASANPLPRPSLRLEAVRCSNATHAPSIGPAPCRRRSSARSGDRGVHRNGPNDSLRLRFPADPHLLSPCDTRRDCEDRPVPPTAFEPDGPEVAPRQPRRPGGSRPSSGSLHFLGVILVTAGPDGSTYPGGFYAKVSFGCSSCGHPPADLRQQRVSPPMPRPTLVPPPLSVPGFAHPVDAGVGASPPQRRSSSCPALRSGGLCSVGLLREKERHP